MNKKIAILLCTATIGTSTISQAMYNTIYNKVDTLLDYVSNYITKSYNEHMYPGKVLEEAIQKRDLTNANSI